MRSTRSMRRIPLLALAVTATACSGGSLGDILLGSPSGGGGSGSGTVTVEVQEVRSTQQQIIVRTQEGRQGPVLYDQNTQVIYQNERYAVENLERGDVVDMRVQEVQQGYYTDLIQVRTPVQERQGGTAGGGGDTGVYAVEGTIGQIDLNRWTFTLNMTQGGAVAVHLPDDASSSDRDRLRQYRSGDYVRVEVRPLDQENAELVRFGWSQ